MKTLELTETEWEVLLDLIGAEVSNTKEGIAAELSDQSEHEVTMADLGGVYLSILQGIQTKLVQP